jgi:hypothetical protein
MVMGLFFMFIFGQVTDLSCARNSDGRTACSTEVKFLGVFTLSTREFKDVYRADVQESCDDEGCNYRVLLTTLEGEQPLTSYYTSSWSGKEETAAQINNFIQDSSNRGILSIQENSGLWASLLSLVFVLSGLYQIVFQGLIKPNQLFNE